MGVQRLYANRLAAISEEQARLKEEKDRIEGFFLAKAEEDLKDTKAKTVSYMGDNVKITVTMAASAKILYPTLLKAFGAYSDLVKEDTTYKLTTAGARLFSGLCKKEYIDMTVADALRQIGTPEQYQLLIKKVKGKTFETDRKNIKTITDCTDEEATVGAYLVAEAAVWQEFDKLCTAQKLDDKQRTELIDTIDAAIIVDEAPKVKVEVVKDEEQTPG